MPKHSLQVIQQIRLKTVETLPDAAIVIAGDGEIIDMNEEAEFLFGYARDDLIGKPLNTLMPEEYRERHSVNLHTFFKAPKRREMGTGMKLEGLHRDGERFLVQIKLAPILVSGEAGGVFGLAIVRRSHGNAA